MCYENVVIQPKFTLYGKCTAMNPRNEEKKRPASHQQKQQATSTKVNKSNTVARYKYRYVTIAWSKWYAVKCLCVCATFKEIDIPFMSTDLPTN